MSNAAPSPSVPIGVSMPGSSLSTVTVTGNPVVDSVIDVDPQTNHSIPSPSVVVVLDLATQGAFREDGVTIPGSDLRENSVVDYVIGVEPPLPLPANHLTNSPSPSVNRFIVISNLTPAMTSLRQTLAQRAFGEEQDGVITETNHPTSTTNLPSPSISYLTSLRHRRTQGPIQEHGVTMPALSTVSNNPVVEFVITNIEPPLPLPLPLPVAEINHQTSSTTNFPSLSVNRFMVILNLAAGRPLASLGRLWTQRAFGGDGVINPGSALSFVIGGL